MMVESKGHVFVSYSRRDLSRVEEILRILERTEVKFWLDVDALVPGSDWEISIGEAISSASAFLVFFGKGGPSRTQEREYRYLADVSRPKGLPVFVVLLPGASNSQLPRNFRDTPNFDLRDEVLDDGELMKLMSALEGAFINNEVAHGSMIGDYQMSANDFEGATNSYERAYETALKTQGYSSEEAVQALIKLAAARHEAGHLSAAEKDLSTAVDALQLVTDRKGASEQLATVYNNLGSVMRDMARFEDAEHYFRRALEVDEHLDHRSAMSARLSSLGSVMRDMARFEDAEHYFRRALEVDEQLGRFLSMATVLANLGSVMRDTGRYEEAEMYFRRALEIDEQSRGADHPSVANRLNNLGSVMRDTGRYEEAEVYFRRALEIDERVHGPGHPSVANRLNNLGSVMRNTGRFYEAEMYFRRALEIDERVHGPDHPSVAITLNNLAGIHLRNGENQLAIQEYARARDLFSKSLGSDHPLTKSAEVNVEKAANFTE